MKHHGNVTKINGAEVEPVDIVSFGSPCQDLSVAGKRAGIQDGERSNLFFEAVRIIKEMREATNGEYPKYAVWENVPGAFSSNKGHDFHAVLEALCSVCDDTVSIPEPYDTKRTKLEWNKAGEIVGDNYSIAWRTLDAQYWGVPQRRKRIYLVADFTGGCAGEILFKSDRLHGNPAESGKAGQSASADAVGSVDGSVGAAGVVSKGNGECFIMPERHMSLSVGGGQAGQGYPCVIHGSVGVECLAVDGYNQTVSDICGSIRAGKADQDHVGCTVYSFDSLSSNSMKSSNPFSGCRAVEVAKCIDTTYPDPSKNQGGVAVVVLNDQGGSSINVESEETSPTLRANSHQHEPVIALQANGIDRADTAGYNGAGWRENESYTLNTVDRHAVCYSADCRNGALNRELSTTLQAKPNGGFSYNCISPVVYDARGNGDGETLCFNEGQITSPTNGNNPQWNEPCHTLSATDSRAPTVIFKKPPRKYIIRRLTPTECARLQGFPDKWGHLAPYDPADADFWEDVRKTHAEINGKKYKPTKNLKKWYEGLHTDSAEYKMWGNGIALPNAEFVLNGIAGQGAKTLGSLFDGSGGFPLAGVLNGIMPLWASEVEPYPIAVTKSRFMEVHNDDI